MAKIHVWPRWDTRLKELVRLYYETTFVISGDSDFTNGTTMSFIREYSQKLAITSKEPHINKESIYHTMLEGLSEVVEEEITEILKV